MLEIVRTDSNNEDFVNLVKLLDADLAQRDGEDHSFYAQFNNIDNLKHVVIAYQNGEPIGCAAIKEYGQKAVEIKRMYTALEKRGKGVATMILTGLETWATELGFEECVLETGKRQPEAIALYKKNGYKIIDNYGQYVGVENSLCFGKKLK